MDGKMLHIISEQLRSQSLEEITDLSDRKEGKDKDSGTESDEELSSITQGMPQSPMSHIHRIEGRSEVTAAGFVGTLEASRESSSSAPAPFLHMSPPSFFSRMGNHGSSSSLLNNPVVFSERTGGELGEGDNHDDDLLNNSDDNPPSAECSVDYSDAFAAARGAPMLVQYENSQIKSSLSSPLPFAAAFPSMDKISDCDSELANLLKDVHTPREWDSEDVEFTEDADPNNRSSPGVRCGSCGSLSAASEEDFEDDEEEELVAMAQPLEQRKSPAPLRFRTSPPRGVHRLNKRTISPKVFLDPVYMARYHPHRRIVQRPHLDFEKMQVTRNTRFLYSVI